MVEQAEEFPLKKDYLLVLGSSSPRRIELCKKLGLDTIVFSPEIDESLILQGELASTAQELTTEISRRKLEAVERIWENECEKTFRLRNHVILSADTMVFFQLDRLGKPNNSAHAEDMLTKLSGNWHDVYTGVSIKIFRNGKEYQKMCFCERTRVKFRKIPIEVIRKYIASGSPMDKAGAYGIQDAGYVFIEQIVGDFYNVMGLPLGRIWELLYNNGVFL